ncbi:hypothetical protein [Virgisporangium ochraceum]|uniref:Uncharacterized protein n=1 Tax=Virgisporangium ochraceum TaxID=65505 RepID=A0A8J3ZQK2_9ACTN|nr:hypothetical protein [Virgisporangium ochraceum]GIJ68372.1 hypothetical protein Voc01_032890 [Virgisporangium ochraceum]
MTGYERLYVSHHQFLVHAGTVHGDLPLHSVGDRLVQVTGASTLTVLTGPHSARLPVRVTVGRPGPDDGFDAASEATLFCERGSLSVGGLMGDFPEALVGLAVGAGLVRVRVHARDRRRDGVPTGTAGPHGQDGTAGPHGTERYEIFVWPVTADAGVVTIADDLVGIAPRHRYDRAATWALRHLLAAADPPPGEARLRAASGDPPWCYPRVEVRRPATGRSFDRFGLTPDGDDLVLPVGDALLRFRFEPAPPDTVRATVRWASPPGRAVPVPDPEPSTVELSTAGLVHRGVRAADAVPLGLLWDHLLRHDGGPRHPWEPVFAAAAAEEAHRAAGLRRRREEEELRRWGGRMPSPRIRTLRANARRLWQLDPDLVEALDAATPDRQRAVARWSARRACAVSRLDTVGWVAEALAAVERDEPLPFDDGAAAFRRLLDDPRAPSTTVCGPDGRPNWSQQALAFPALLAAADADPLVAAVDAVEAAAAAHGDAHRDVLAEVRAFVEGLEFPP